MVYGLLIDNELFHLKTITQNKQYKDILDSLNLENGAVETYKIYPEQMWSKLGRKVCQTLGMEEKEFFEGVGKSFVKFVQELKLDSLVKQIGREYREFVMNLDNVHQYLGQKFPKMRAPSYFVESETSKGNQYKKQIRKLHHQFFLSKKVWYLSTDQKGGVIHITLLVR